VAEQDITSKLEAMNRISELVRQRDDLLVKLESMICKGCNCSDCKIARATIAKAQPSNTSVQPKKSGVIR